jgi:hypothetical protein
LGEIKADFFGGTFALPSLLRLFIDGFLLREVLVGIALLALATFGFVSSTDASMCGLHDMRCGYGPHGGTNRDPVYNAVCPRGRRMCPPGQCAPSGRRDACDMTNCAAKNCPH